MKTQKLYIVDDHELFREGVKLMLEKFKHIEIVGEAETAEVFLDSLDTNEPDIVLLDIDLPGVSGEDACKIATFRYPDLKVIAVSNYSDEDYYYRMLEAGARGYVAKQLSVGELLSAIEHVANGEFYFSDKILKEILVRQPDTNFFRQNATTKKTTVKLSAKESEILDLLSKGNTESEIANFAGISLDEVNKSIELIMKKTGATDHIQLIMFSISQGEVNVGLN